MTPGCELSKIERLPPDTHRVERRKRCWSQLWHVVDEILEQRSLCVKRTTSGRILLEP